jgi:flagellar motor switch protein FliM
MPGDASGSAVAFDFRRPLTLAREHARKLEGALETFSRQWANQLAMRLRSTVTPGQPQVGIATYDDFMTSLPSLTTMLLFTAEPGRRTGLLQLPVDVSLSWIDQLLGGPGFPRAVPDRELTEIERKLLLELLGRIWTDLDYAFAGLLALRPTFTSVEFSPQELQALDPTTPVITARLTLHVEETEVAAMLMLPAEGLLGALREAAEVHARKAVGTGDAASLALLERVVQEAPVELGMRFRPVRVRSSEVVRLAVGTLLPLRHPATRPLDVVVGDRVVSRAVIGTHGSQLAGLVVNVKENA